VGGIIVPGAVLPQASDRAEATGSPLTLTPRSPPLSMQKALPLDLSIVDWGSTTARSAIFC
jgi:hypothetical protein